MEFIVRFSEIPPDLLEFFEPVDAPVDHPDLLTISSEPLSEKHYAAFPTALVAWCLRAGTSARGYCPDCGAPWARVVETTPVGSYHDHSGDGREYGLTQSTGRPRALDGRPSEANLSPHQPPRTLDWRPTCTCTPPRASRPAVVLDPYCGSGRTGIAAQRMGLDFIGVELNAEYVTLAKKLLYSDAPLFAEIDPT